jgi:hypothetical protein
MKDSVNDGNVWPIGSSQCLALCLDCYLEILVSSIPWCLWW